MSVIQAQFTTVYQAARFADALMRPVQPRSVAPFQDSHFASVQQSETRGSVTHIVECDVTRTDTADASVRFCDTFTGHEGKTMWSVAFDRTSLVTKGIASSIATPDSITVSTTGARALIFGAALYCQLAHDGSPDYSRNFVDRVLRDDHNGMMTGLWRIDFLIELYGCGGDKIWSGNESDGTAYTRYENNRILEDIQGGLITHRMILSGLGDLSVNLNPLNGIADVLEETQRRVEANEEPPYALLS